VTYEEEYISWLSGTYNPDEEITFRNKTKHPNCNYWPQLLKNFEQQPSRNGEIWCFGYRTPHRPFADRLEKFRRREGEKPFRYQVGREYHADLLSTSTLQIDHGLHVFPTLLRVLGYILAIQEEPVPSTTPCIKVAFKFCNAHCVREIWRVSSFIVVDELDFS